MLQTTGVIDPLGHVKTDKAIVTKIVTYTYQGGIRGVMRKTFAQLFLGLLRIFRQAVFGEI